MPDKTTDEALLSALLDAAVDAIIIADREGRITRANNAACELFGHAPGEMTGKSVGILMAEPLASQHDGYVRRHVETGETHIIGTGREVEGVTSDGTPIPLHISVGRADKQGEVVFVGILRDLTAQKAAERALERSQRMEALGELTGGVAHDFNNILTVIMGNLELLEDMVEPGEAFELLKDALDATDLGADLTARLLAFARRGSLSPEDVEVNALVGRVVALLGRIFGPTFNLHTRLAPDAASIHVDATQLQTAIINLALNAHDAMPEGGNLLFETANAVIDDDYIAQETDIAPGDYVKISVTDAGRGMSEETQRRAFEPFFTTKPAGKGTGMGLATVYGFLKQSGGHVTLYSEPGEGTTISLYLPLPTGDERQQHWPRAAEPAAPATGAGRVVLAVDDNPSVLRIALSRLEALGYRAIGAADAEEALAIIASEPAIDVLFTDLVMPGELSGLELAERVRKEHPEIRILLTSGYARDLMDGPAFEQNGFELLRKPYRQAELSARLRAILAGAGG